MKVLVMVIASGGVEYECMKAMWLLQWQQALEALPGADLWFLQGDSCIRSTPHDKTYSVKECVVPGLLQKTLCGFKDFLDTGHDIVVRTNLSSVYIWHRLAAYLAQWHGTADVAGFSDDRSHFSGCNLILSRALVQLIVDNRHLLDYSVPDDVSLSKFLLERDIAHAWTPRLDIIDSKAFLKGTSNKKEVFHVRVKGSNRMADVQSLYAILMALRKNPDFV
jgi:hypothetical protein